MAKEFPHATVLGVDLVPCPANPSDVPPNCRFEIDDVNDGLDHFTGAFDVVHVRNIAWGVRLFPPLTMSHHGRHLRRSRTTERLWKRCPGA
jgi:hypothetical protein